MSSVRTFYLVFKIKKIPGKTKSPIIQRMEEAYEESIWSKFIDEGKGVDHALWKYELTKCKRDRIE